MTALLPHQQRLLEHLEREPRQRAILLSAPPGSGLNAVITQFAAESARRGELVVIISDFRLLVDQWVYRLTQAEAYQVVRLSASSDVLMELNRMESGSDHSRILVVTIQLLSRGIGRKLADALHPKILVVDRLSGLRTGLRRELLEDLISRSESAIVLTDTAGPEWFRPTESIGWNRDDRRPNTPSVETLSYEPSEHESEVYTRALKLLNDAARDLVSRPRTRPAIHASVLRLIASLSGDHIYEVQDDNRAVKDARETQVRDDARPAMLQEAWAIIDSLEELDDDGRLAAIYTLVQRAAKERRPCIVAAELVVEADYVAAYLQSRNIPVFLLSAENSPAQWRQVHQALAEENVVIMTTTTFEIISNPPQRTQVVWWSSPRTATQFRRWLALAARAPQSTVITITASPPLPGEQDLKAILNTAAQ